MRQRAVLLIYGEGGHRAQMKNLHALLIPGMTEKGLLAVGICENNDALDGFYSYSQRGMRDKHSRLKTILGIPLGVTHTIWIILRLVTRYKIVGVVSTGPGIVLLPSMVLKCLGAKIVFLESWSRFETCSLTGRFMYRIADRFYVQNKSLLKSYPAAHYGGLL